MFKINKTRITNSITYSIVGTFGILVVFILSVVATIMVFMPMKANAQNYYNWPAPSSGNNNGYYNGYYNGTNYNYYGNGSNIPNPTPIVYEVTPNSANAVSGNMAVILTGANFVPNSMAKWNNSYRSTAFTDANHLTVILTATDLATAGNFTISVSNPAPGGGNSNGVFFTVNPYVVPSVAPSIASAAPSNSSTSSNTKSVATASVAKTVNTNKINNTNGSYGSLAANALFGTNSFIPSSLIQWLFLAILILVAIILVRKLHFGKQYHETPLKHL